MHMKFSSARDRVMHFLSKLKSFRVGNLDEKYDREEVMVIPFSYYDIVVEKCTVRGE